MPFNFTMPKLSPTMTEGTITKWHKKEGEYVEAGEAIIEVATDKATVEHTALDGGYLRKILVHEGEQASVNQAIAIFTEEKDEEFSSYLPKKEEAVKREEPKKAEEAPKKKEVAPMQTPVFAIEPPLQNYKAEEESDRMLASPLAKKLAKEQKLDLTTVKGSGPRGRVQSEDLPLAQKEAAAVFGSKKKPMLPPGSYEEEALSPMRKKIAERLQQAKMAIPHFYVGITIDAEPMHLLREQLKAQEIKVTFNDFVVKACAVALKKHPEVNTGFNAVSNAIVKFQTIDISIAVTVEGGLITPIIRHADYKNLGQISTEIKHLAEKARAHKLQPEEYKGGSFTVSNLGMFGIETFTAIINPPQAAILAVGGIQERPVVKNNQVVPGKTLSLTLSCDHRVLDGAIAAQFLKTLQAILETPAILLVG